MKKIRLLLLPFLTFAMSLASCNRAGGGNQNVEVSAVKLDQTSITLDVGSSKQLTATVEPDNATDKTVTWSTSDNTVASVSNGLVRGAKKGTAVITATAGDKNATCNVTVNEVVIAKALQAIKVTPPNKTTYYVGDELDLTGIKVIAVYTDRSEETLSSDKYTVSGFDSSAPVSNQSVTVSYTYESKTKTGNFNVTILEKPAPTVASIAVTQEPTKKEYEIGEPLDTNGLVVTATYSDGTTKEVTGYTLSGFSSERAGRVTVTVTFGGKSATFTVTIKEAPTIVTITDIEVATMPTKLSYEIGEPLDTTGMVVKAVKSDGAKEEVTGWTTSGFSSETSGEKTVTVSWKDASDKEYTTTFKVTVLAAPVLESIKVDVSNAKVEYEYNEDLDTTGVVVTTKYDRGDDKTIAISECEVSGYNKTTAGEQTITVTYEGKKDTYKVTVNEKAPELQSLVLDTTNVKVTYEIGDNADFSGLVVKAHYDKGDDVTLTSNQYEISGFDSATSGTKTITVSYSGKTETFDITINEPVTPPTPSKTLSSIAVTTNPTKTEYTVGDELDKTGMVITATYSDSSAETIDNSLVTTDFDSSAAAESKTVTVIYEGKTATFTVKIIAAPVVHADHIIFYKKGSADWVELALVENNDHEYKLNEEIHFDVGDKFLFHMTGSDWRRYSDIKDGGANAKFEADSDDNFVVLMAGDYQFYVDTNGSAPSVYTVRNNIPVSLEAAYGNEYAFVNGTIDGSKVDVHYVYDDGSKGVNIATDTIFYVLLETAPDTFTPYEVSDQTVIAESMLGTMRVYASLETDIANVNPTNDPYFDVQIIYKNYVHHQVGQNFVDTPLTEDYFEHKCAIIELAEGAKFAVRTNGIWTSGLVGDYSGQGYYDQSGDLYRDDYTSIWQGSSDLEKVVDFPYDVSWKATIAGKYVIGVHEDSWGVIAYRLNWTVTLTRASDPLNPEVLDPTNFIFREYQFERLDLAEGDVLTIERIYDKEGHSIKYGYNYVSDPNSVFEKFSKDGAIDYFAPYDGTNSFVVKAGCGGIYSFYLKHEMVYYSKPGHGQSATYSPSIYIVKEDIWHYTKGATDEEMPYDPYDSANKVILSNIDLEAGDEIGFYNAVMADIGYSNIADDGQRAHFTQGANNKLVVKDGEAGAYTFHITRSTGAITVDYTSVADQYNFVKNKYYVVGTADFSSGTSVDGASWNDASKAFLMVADDEHKPEEYNHQFKATVKFNENDEWKVRTNIYMPYNLENAGALENNVYMEVQNGNLKVNRTGTYDIYFKMKDDGYCSMYISKAIDFTVDKSSVTVGVGETKNVAVSYSDGRDFTADLEATSAKEAIATANAQYSLKQVAITGVAVGETTVTITDGRTSQVVNVTVTAEPMPASGFGIQFEDNSFIAGVDAGEYDGFLQYRLENIHLEVGDKFNLVDFSNGARWAVNIDASSFSDAVATYLDKGAEYYEVLTECYVDIYIKLKQGQDQIYFGLYDIMLNGVRDNANESIENGDQGFVTASMWTGTLSATVTEGADKVEIVSVNQENGKITFRGIGVGDATITVSANGFERTISVTVSLAAKAYIAGIDGNWTAGQETYKLTKVGDGHYQITGVEIQQGDKIKIVYTVDDGAHYTWYGNDSTWPAVEDIIKKEGESNVEFLQDGTYTIDFYVSADGNNHVVPAKTGELTSLYVDSTQKNVEAGNTVTITATHFIGTLSASSDDETKATIDSINQETGVITINGVVDGEAHITVSATGNANVKVVTITVAPIPMVTITLKSNKDVGSGNRLYFVGTFSNWKINANAIVFQYVTDHWEVTFEIVQGTTYTGKLVIGAWENPAAEPTGWEGGDDRVITFTESTTITLDWQ